MTDHTPLTEQQLEQAFVAELDDDRALTLLDELTALRAKRRCTCARSAGLHEKSCRRYVAGHELISPVLRLTRAREELGASKPEETGWCTFGEDDAPGAGCILPAGHQPPNRHLVTPGDVEFDD
jgi:hypothetical protein